MSIIPPLGATCLGVVIGWLVRYFIRRFQTFNPQVLGTVISIIAGGAVVRFLDADRTVWWFYPIGLLLGFVLYTAVAVIFARKFPSDGVLFGRPLQSSPQGSEEGGGGRREKS